MIERDFVAQKTKEYYIKQYIEGRLKNAGISHIKLKKIPLGEKIIIYTNRPSLVVGSKGGNIKELTKILKKEFNLENPQVEISEVKEPYLDAHIVAERIATSLERFGSARFKGIGHKMIANVINSGALGVEIVFSGKIPSARAKSWRFYQGYLKKCGDAALTGVRSAQMTALLKSGAIGIKVAIMPPDVVLPDRVDILETPQQPVEELLTEKPKEEKPKTHKAKKGSATRRAPKKKEDSNSSPSSVSAALLESPAENVSAVAAAEAET